MVHYFKRLQDRDSYHYYEVHGGDGKTKNGYQVVINLLNPESRVISVEHNYITDTSGLTSTWCQFEVGEPITEVAFKEAYKRGRTFESVNLIVNITTVISKAHPSGWIRSQHF